MNTFSKFSDIEAVMVKAEKTLDIIESEYKKSLEKQTIDESLLVEIKDYLGNIRSAIDYLWHKIPNTPKDKYFPIANSVNDFNNRTTGIDQKYLSVLEKWQPYNNQVWMTPFSIMRNKNSHVTLIPQKRTETREFSIKGKNGSSIIMRGCTFGGNGTVNFGIDGKIIPIDKSTQFPADVPGVDIERKIWVDFLFDGKEYSPALTENMPVLPFLKTCFENIKKIIQEIEILI